MGPTKSLTFSPGDLRVAMISKDFEFLMGMHPDDDCFLGSKNPGNVASIVHRGDLRVIPMLNSQYVQFGIQSNKQLALLCFFFVS